MSLNVEGVVPPKVPAFVLEMAHFELKDDGVDHFPVSAVDFNSRALKYNHTGSVNSEDFWLRFLKRPAPRSDHGRATQVVSSGCSAFRYCWRACRFGGVGCKVWYFHGSIREARHLDVL